MIRAHSIAGLVIAGISALYAGDTAVARESILDFGKREYAMHCALCHGLTGKGDGSYNQTLERPSDLTVLASANKGVFPYRRVYEIIDGRREIEAHGTRDMPIWGAYYQALGGEENARAARDQKAYVRTRIKALVAYIKRLQVN